VVVIRGNFLQSLHELFARDINCSVEQLLLVMSIHAVTLEQFKEAYYMQSMWYNQLKVHVSESLAVSLPCINSRLWVRIAFFNEQKYIFLENLSHPYGTLTRNCSDKSPEKP